MQQLSGLEPIGATLDRYVGGMLGLWDCGGLTGVSGAAAAPAGGGTDLYNP
jgi:hypothetical protein